MKYRFSYFKFLFLLLCAWVSGGSVFGQDALPPTQTNIILDSAAVVDSPKLVMSQELSPAVDSFLWEYQYRRSPKRAGMYAALIPGFGQIYNRQYWKLILVYGAMGTSTGFIIYNTKEYNKTRKEIADRITQGYRVNPELSFLDNNQLIRREEYYKSNLDVSVLLTGLGYLLQIMEAISANHMKEFDITPDISMRFKTSTLPHNQIGLGIAFHLK